MSAYERLTRTLPDGHEITILTPGRRRGGRDGRQRPGGGDHLPLRREVGPRGRSHVHPAVDPTAVHTHTTEVSMHER